MRQVFGLVMLVMVLGGCTAMKDGAKISYSYSQDTKVKTVEDQGFWGPTVKTVYTYECVPQDGVEPLVNEHEGKTYTCHGRYVAVQPQTGIQSGVMASTVVPMAVAGEQAAGFYFGMRDFGMNQNTNRITNNNDTSSNGGNSTNANMNQPYSISNSGSSSKASAGKGHYRR